MDKKYQDKLIAALNQCHGVTVRFYLYAKIKYGAQREFYFPIEDRPCHFDSMTKVNHELQKNGLMHLERQGPNGTLYSWSSAWRRKGDKRDEEMVNRRAV